MEVTKRIDDPREAKGSGKWKPVVMRFLAGSRRGQGGWRVLLSWGKTRGLERGCDVLQPFNFLAKEAAQWISVTISAFMNG